MQISKLHLISGYELLTLPENLSASLVSVGFVLLDLYFYVYVL